MRTRSIYTSATAAALVLLGMASVHAAEPERIFANGFDPCCRLGGTVLGLAGTGLVLHLAAGTIAEDKAIVGDGLYDFVASVPPSTPFTLAVTTQPAGQTCAVAIAAGSMGTTDITNADVSCAVNLQWDSGTWGQDWN
ncbi:MAG TPA: hypothetical protein VFN09_07265 [Rhodanobacteraceae bacterium]|nr:hypothetical protein [Rhodanobacteraceae bacterium]